MLARAGRALFASRLIATVADRWRPRPLGAHLILREIGAGAEGRAGPPLALYVRSDPQQQRAILVIGNLSFFKHCCYHTPVCNPAVSA
jgi:hypothetical protein